MYSHSLVGLVLVDALPVADSLLPLSVVDVPVGVGVLALAVLQIVDVLTLVFPAGGLEYIPPKNVN